MQLTTGCKINVSPAAGRDIEREIGLVGSRAATEAAKRAIMEKVHAVVRVNVLLFLQCWIAYEYQTTGREESPVRRRRLS